MNIEIKQSSIKPRSTAGSANQTQPLYIDKFTQESAREKKRLYEQYRQEGEDLHELRVTAEVVSEVVLDDGELLDSAYSQVTYTFTFATFAEAKTYAEKIYSDSLKYPDIPLFDEHHASLGFVWCMTLSHFHIVEICPTEREIAIMSAYLTFLPNEPEPSTIPWESDEDPTELGGQAA